MRSSQRLLILQHELVDWYYRTENDDVTRIFGMTQEIRFGHELESGRLDFLAQHTLLDAMERLADARAIAGTRGMVSDNRKPPGFNAANIFRFISARSTGI